MRWSLKPKAKHQKWHRWFAWYPVVLSDTGDRVWMQTVWRIYDAEVIGPKLGCGAWVYELDVGEKRYLDPSRLIQCKAEAQFRARQSGMPALYRDGKRWIKICPDGAEMPISAELASIGIIPRTTAEEMHFAKQIIND